MRAVLLFLAAGATASAADHSGVVKFGGLPLPGASVVVTQGGKERSAVTDAEGRYSIGDLASEPFAVEIQKLLFVAQRRKLDDPSQPAEWEMDLAPGEQLDAFAVRQQPSYRQTAVTAEAAPRQAQESPPDPELARQAADGFLIDGSVLNANASPFAQSGAFGNNRRGQRSLYNGSLGVILNNALFDARSYSLTGQNTAKPNYNRVQGLLAFGGPLRIPKLLPSGGPTFTVNYQWTRKRNATTRSGLMPTADERAGIPEGPVLDPATGDPFPGHRIPASRLSPEARALLGLYPAPNFNGGASYNFQLPIVSGLHQDELQTRMNKRSGRNGYSGSFSLKSTRTDSPDLFGFLDTGSVTGWDAGFTYRRTLSPRSFFSASVNVNRLATRVTPWFSNRANVSGEAGICGNNQEAVNWGPPNLVFSNGITPLSFDQASRVHNQTASASLEYFFSKNGHNMSAGYTHRFQQLNTIAQQDARGTFTFTGAAAGNDFAGFLLGIPDTAAIAFGNADKYLRGRVHEAFVNDDWRVNPGFTVNVDARWEYWSPAEEKYGRLVNLDVGQGFTTAVPISTLPRGDFNNVAPRVAFSWRPFPASSMVVRTRSVSSRTR